MNGLATIPKLRHLLADKFPAIELKPSGVLATGLPALDEAEGGLRRGSLTELAGTMSAGGLFIEAMLSVLQREKCFAALMDGGSSFDPCACAVSGLRRLLVVTCRDEKHAIKTAGLWNARTIGNSP